jgi:steroid 5-alpha reductase family enzyme
MIMLSAIFFNSINASLNAYYLGHFSELYPADWFFDMRFILGLLLFLLGAFINIHSDNILLGLRKEGDTSYSIPMGGGFNYVSCPNLFGEILEWMGFAILCWNLPALTFAIWTAANLIPRAIAHHKWYLQQFPKYPRDRKALVPFLF